MRVHTSEVVQSKTLNYRGRKMPIHSSSSSEIYSRICSAALSPVQQSFLVCVCVGGGGGLETKYFRIGFKTYLFVGPSQDKNPFGKRSRPQADKQLAQVPFFQAIFKTKRFCFCLLRVFSVYVFKIKRTCPMCSWQDLML